MYTIHDRFMPAELQEGLMEGFDTLTDYDTINPAEFDNPMLREAEQWFMTTVHDISKSHTVDDVTLQVCRGSKISGEAENTDIHSDNPLNPSSRIKYVLVVANNTRSGTLFFEKPARMNLSKRRSEQLFGLEQGKLVLSSTLRVELVWEQAQVGQVCSFDTYGQLHAAAPLYPGDKKFVFSHVTLD